VYPPVDVVQQPICPSGHDDAIVPPSDCVHDCETADCWSGVRFEYP
jgi:hypothetical protein